MSGQVLSASGTSIPPVSNNTPSCERTLKRAVVGASLQNRYCPILVFSHHACVFEVCARWYFQTRVRVLKALTHPLTIPPPPQPALLVHTCVFIKLLRCDNYDGLTTSTAILRARTKHFLSSSNSLE